MIFNKTEGGTINIPSTVSPLSTTVGAAAGDYTFSGGSIAGAGSLTKEGSSTLTLAFANTYTGTTVGNIQTVTVNVTTPPVGGKLFVRVQAAPTP